MYSMKSKTILYLYNQLFDPVIQSNIFLYVKDIVATPGNQHRFAIVTFETKQTLADQERIEKVKADLAQLNVLWYPCQWHPGTSLFLKLIDLLASFYRVGRLRFSGYGQIISLASVAGSYAYLFSVVLRMRLYLYQYEPHSEYEVDSGTYGRESLTFKILNTLEKRAAFFASVISSGTHHMIDRLTEWGVKAALYRIPSVTNENKFKFSAADRIEIRRKYGIPDEKWVLYYPGKFGGLYFTEETVDMFEVLLNRDPRFHAVVVTPNDLTEIESYFTKRSIPKDRFTVTRSTFDNIQKYNSAADFAVIAVPPGPSKKFVSNIKVGEYLCSGLPYLICKGVSEDDEYAINYNVGVVVDDFSKDQIELACEKIIRILSQPDLERRSRCRKVGEEYRGFANLKLEFRKAFYQLITK
jgi:hypothetical protein